MSGGAYEYVMVYTINASSIGGNSGITALYPNFFTDSTYTKYWDKYTSTTNTQFNLRILGDATGEMGPFQNTTDPDGNARYKSSWYGNYAFFANSSNPWLHRGGFNIDGTSSGLFSFASDRGLAQLYFSYRIVLTPSI